MNHLEPNVTGVLWFVPLWCVCCLGFLQLAGMYPLNHRTKDAPRKSVALVLANTAIWLALLTGTLAFAYAELRWTTIIVVAGILFLFVPEAFQAVPEKWRDSRAGLAAAACLMIGALAVLAVIGAEPIRSLLT